MKITAKRATAGMECACEVPGARRPRGRPRCFDRAAALEAAMDVFWRKGFEAASLNDLTAAMGINPPSLYAAFGDKERLFLEAVVHYEDTQFALCPYVEEPTARAAVERLLRHVADEMATPEHPGCLMVMTMAISGCSQELKDALAQVRAEVGGRFRARIERGIRDGDVPAGTDAGALSDFYGAVFSGMALLARSGATRKSLRATAEQALQVFPEPPARRVRGVPRRKPQPA
jgi:AcrR family transcriptional regulator